MRTGLVRKAELCRNLHQAFGKPSSSDKRPHDSPSLQGGAPFLPESHTSFDILGAGGPYASEQKAVEAYIARLLRVDAQAQQAAFERQREVQQIEREAEAEARKYDLPIPPLSRRQQQEQDEFEVRPYATATYRSYWTT